MREALSEICGLCGKEGIEASGPGCLRFKVKNGSKTVWACSKCVDEFFEALLTKGDEKGRPPIPRLSRSLHQEEIPPAEQVELRKAFENLLASVKVVPYALDIPEDDESEIRDLGELYEKVPFLSFERIREAASKGSVDPNARGRKKRIGFSEFRLLNYWFYSGGTGDELKKLFGQRRTAPFANTFRRT